MPSILLISCASKLNLWCAQISLSSLTAVSFNKGTTLFHRKEYTDKIDLKPSAHAAVPF